MTCVKYYHERTFSNPEQLDALDRLDYASGKLLCVASLFGPKLLVSDAILLEYATLRANLIKRFGDALVLGVPADYLTRYLNHV